MEACCEPVIFDLGSSSIKFNLGSMNCASLTPTIIGTKCHKLLCGYGFGDRDCWVGDECNRTRFCFKIHYPMKHGVVSNWEYIGKLLRDCCYHDLRTAPEEHSFLFSEPIFNSKEQREKISQIMFDELCVHSLCFKNQSELSLIANNKKSGIVVDSGDGITQIVPVYNGNRIESAMKRIDIGGRTITDCLFEELNKKGNEFQESNEMEFIRETKEKVCYISSDYQNEIYQNKQIEYELPDGEKIQIGNERIKCTEIMFTPSLIHSEENGIHQMINEAISKCDNDIQNEMYNNIVLSGGNTLIDGFEKRIEYELKEMETKSFNLISPSNRKYSTWIGGSIISNLSSFNEMCVTKDEYDEKGPEIFNLNC